MGQGNPFGALFGSEPEPPAPPQPPPLPDAEPEIDESSLARQRRAAERRRRGRSSLIVETGLSGGRSGTGLSIR